MTDQFMDQFADEPPEEKALLAMSWDELIAYCAARNAAARDDLAQWIANKRLPPLDGRAVVGNAENAALTRALFEQAISRELQANGTSGARALFERIFRDASGT